MRATLAFAVLAVLAVSVAAQSSTGGSGPVPPTGASLCDKIVYNMGGDFTNKDSALSMLKKFVSWAGKPTATTGFLVDPKTNALFSGAQGNYHVAGSPYVGTPVADLTVDGTAQSNFYTKVATFLGQSGALACSASGFPAYSLAAGFNQYNVHMGMNITGTQFSSFNSYVTNAASLAKLSTADQNAVSQYLSSFGANNAANANAICSSIALGCPCASGVTGNNCDNTGAASSVQVSFVTMMVAALLAVFAMRR